MTALTLRWAYHGGGCCGCAHIFGFPHSNEPMVYNPAIGRHERMTYTPEDFVRSIRDMWRRQFGFNNRRTTEVTLTQSQCLPAALTGLRQLGFRLVGRFKNSNSGNVVYIFHHTPLPMSLDPADLPFEWGPPIDVETFRRVGKNGHTNAVFASLEDAQRGMSPTMNSIDRFVNDQRVGVAWTREGAFNPFN